MDSQVLIQGGYQSFGLFGAGYACFCLCFPFLYCFFTSRLFLVPFILSRQLGGLIVHKFEFICIGIWMNKRLFIAPNPSHFNFKHWRISWSTLLLHNISCFDLVEFLPFAFYKYKSLISNIYQADQLETDYKIAFRHHYLRNDYHFQYSDPLWNHHIKKEKIPRKMHLQSILEMITYWISQEEQNGKWMDSEKQRKFSIQHLDILNFNLIPQEKTDPLTVVRFHPVTEQFILAIFVLLKIIQHENFDWDKGQDLMEDDLEREMFKELKYCWALKTEQIAVN